MKSAHNLDIFQIIHIYKHHVDYFSLLLSAHYSVSAIKLSPQTVSFGWDRYGTDLDLPSSKSCYSSSPKPGETELKWI